MTNISLNSNQFSTSRHRLLLQALFPSPELQLLAIFTIQVTYIYLPYIPYSNSSAYNMIAIIALITNSFLRRFSIRKTSREGFWFDGLSASMSMILWKKRFFSNLLDDDDDYERNIEIMKTQVFHAWRDDLDNRRPGKERALIQVEL